MLNQRILSKSRICIAGFFLFAQSSFAAPVTAPTTVPTATAADLAPAGTDWLVTPITQKAVVYQSADGREIILTNGLIRRTWRISPNVATVAFDNLMTGESILRAVEPEARVKLDGADIDIGGLVGQPDRAYLKPSWLDSMTAAPGAMKMIRYEAGATVERFAWKRVRHARPGAAWPPPGASLRFDFQSQPDGVVISVHYEMYDGVPLICKWLTISNRSQKDIRLNSFTSELLAAVEANSVVDNTDKWQYPNLHVESDYAFGGSIPGPGDQTTHWVTDPEYHTQVNYQLKTPCVLESRPPIGPDAIIAPGGSLETFRTFELVHDSFDKERQGLEIRRMYRTIAPWVTENPIMMHLTSATPAGIDRAIQQCKAVGFEMIILSFGSGVNMESTDPKYLLHFKELADKARNTGLELGGYSLLASRHISDSDDVINPKTGKIGGAIFGNSPCLCSAWGQAYFQHVGAFIRSTDFSLLENDGSYPGDLCASTAHPGHHGLEDSQWTQWKAITDFYHACRADGVYLNVPDWYFLNGSNKDGMGYRETNWSLPRDQQIIHARQNMFDGTWEKTPSMGWMFVPLVQYHGGGAAATIEPLSQHLDAYGAHLANCFGYGVQACYRGPRLFDTDATEAVVKKWVDFFKSNRDILESDVIHLRRCDGRDWDGILHVNPQLKIPGLAMIYNPLDEPIARTIRLPLYYTGITGDASVRIGDGQWNTITATHDAAQITLTVPAHGAVPVYVRGMR